MSQKSFSISAAFIFMIVFTLHALRIFLGWEVVVASTTIPMWVSWLALFLAGTLAFYGCKHGTK